jgi:hypothetical protein
MLFGQLRALQQHFLCMKLRLSFVHIPHSADVLTYFTRGGLRFETPDSEFSIPPSASEVSQVS